MLPPIEELTFETALRELQETVARLEGGDLTLDESLALFERGQSLADSTREAQLQWQVELLNNQVQRLKEDARRATSSVTFYPAWWW